MSERFLVFPHIEKNGGITLHEILHKAYPGYVTPRPNYGEIFSSNDLSKLRQVYPVKIQGLGGHRISCIEKYCLDQFVFTFLRNPVDRYMSHLNYQIVSMGIDWSIEEFIEDKFFNDFQTFRISPNRNLKEAIELIENKFSFVGLIEDYNNSLKYLSEKLQNPLIRGKYTKRNVISKSDKKYIFSELPSNIKAKIVDNNKQDSLLYNHVKENIYPVYQKEFENFNFMKETLISTNDFKDKLFHFKRKLSTFYVGRIIQPYYLRQMKNVRGR